MSDQATSLRRLIQDKTEYNEPTAVTDPSRASMPAGATQPATMASNTGTWKQEPTTRIIKNASAVRPMGASQPYATQPAVVSPVAGQQSRNLNPSVPARPYIPQQMMQPAQSPIQKSHIYKPTQQLLQNDREKGSRTIAVTSGKGGVGKTNLTVNLAIAIAKEQKRVLIIDADLGMANVDVLLGTSSKYHLMQLLEPGVTLEDIVIRGPYGVSYISGGSAMENAVDLSQLERRRLMEKLSGCSDMADIILIDTGAGLGQNVMQFILASDEVVLITTPEPTALTDAYGVMKAYSNLAVSKNMRLVVNRVYDEPEFDDVLTKLQRTAEKFLSMPLKSLGAIYEDRNVMNAVKKQVPLLEAYPNTLAARCIDAIAKNILYGEGHEVKWGWRGFLQKLLKFKG